MPAPTHAPVANQFTRTEWAGAFGDLGTLIPFVVAYITLLDMDPAGVLLGFGLAKIVIGILYKTPFPVQPMKAIGAAATTQATQSFLVTPATVYASGLVTGVIWLVLAMTGLAERIARWTPRALVTGIVLGLGFKFMGDGIEMMANAWALAAVSIVAALLLLGNRALPAMFVLLLIGIAAAFYEHPDLATYTANMRPHFQWPDWHLDEIAWRDLVGGTLLLALPQLPLTLGNAMIAITDENNRLFPGRPVTHRRVALSTGVMNLLAPTIGGVPMCHGAGGMAGHVRFGAQTGGALIILGTILTTLALFLSDFIVHWFEMFPEAVLGTILFLAGAQLALGVGNLGEQTASRFTVLVTAAFALWNVGLAFVAGLAVHVLIRKGWVRL